MYRRVLTEPDTAVDLGASATDKCLTPEHCRICRGHVGHYYKSLTPEHTRVCRGLLRHYYKSLTPEHTRICRGPIGHYYKSVMQNILGSAADISVQLHSSIGNGVEVIWISVLKQHGVSWTCA